MELDGVQISNEQELRKLVEQINADIASSDKFDGAENKDTLLNMQKILYLYRRLKRKEERDAFRIRNDCKKCYFFQERKCPAVRECLLEK